MEIAWGGGGIRAELKNKQYNSRMANKHSLILCKFAKQMKTPFD